MSFYLNLEGLDNINKKISELDEKVKQEVSNEINASALKIQSDAKRLAPNNFGQLRGSIKLSPESTGSLTYIVAATASYAAYVEFGTGGKVSIPAGFEDDAAKFKGGQNGTFKDMVEALTLWVKRKGIGNGKNDKGLAYVIARSILQKGLRPQPFLIPAYEQEKPKLIKRLKELLNA
jgi:HK97 gp10 family phage protein